MVRILLIIVKPLENSKMVVCRVKSYAGEFAPYVDDKGNTQTQKNW